MNKLLHPLYGYPLAGLEFIRAIGQSMRHLGESHQPSPQHTITEHFFGVNVAPADNAEGDDYICARLSELGLRHVRMHFSYESLQGPAERLLERLLGEGFEVMLDLLPPAAEANLIFDDVQAQQRWGNFVETVFSRWGERVHAIEIGNTPNRGKWSGFSSPGIVMATYIARQRTRDATVPVGGPNVSDFEPLYNATYLSMLNHLDVAPAIHTDNLFVERVVEPEAFDHRVLGRLARDLLKLNLVKKARMLKAMGTSVGASQLYCTYTCWTIKRLQRRYAEPEQKRVDYLVRYLALASASEALDKVYWGPLICSRDGLIDDAADDYPVIDQVSYYQRIRGNAAHFQPTPAFTALGYLIDRMAGAQCQQFHHDPAGLTLGQFIDSEGKSFLLTWCRDAQALPLSNVLSSGQLRHASFRNAGGESMDAPVVINEHPLYIDLPMDTLHPGLANSQFAPAMTSLAHLSSRQWQSTPLQDSAWYGAAMLRADAQQEDLEAAPLLHPAALGQYPELQVMRDKRNRLWNIADPRQADNTLTVKLNRVVGFKRFTYRFRPSKGRRHWDNACQMLRRGVATPLPVAFFEAPEQAGIRDSWYVCQFVPNAFSSRDVYRAFNDGAATYRGLDKATWFDIIAGFVCHMHDKQIIHRDLSSGNLLLIQADDGQVEAMAIDIGRARTWSGPGSKVRNRDRMLDLIRIAYKLTWPDRELFIDVYEQHLGKSLSPLWRIPFHYYDNKQRFKKWLKRKRGK